MCLASMYYMKNQYQEALDIYKQYLAQNRYYIFSFSLTKIVRLFSKKLFRIECLCRTLLL
jgi:hypothetical protein